MKFDIDCLALADFIAEYHQEFAEAGVWPGRNSHAWDILRRAVDYLRREGAARSVQFPAMLRIDMTKGKTVYTEISLSLDGDSVVYTERTDNPAALEEAAATVERRKAELEKFFAERGISP